jgi:large subunit ribosomal protein L9
MEVILNKTIDNLGLEGDIVNVKPGYARNFLIPQQMAMPVSKQNMARLQQEKDAIASRLERERKDAEALSGKLSGITIEIARRVGDDDRLFGSVTSADIAEKLAAKGITVDRRAIVLNDPIKSLGETRIGVKVGFQMTTEIIVQVIPETEGE